MAMTKSPEEMQFERAQAAYEQNCVTFRSLNQLMWQIPLIAMTLTGGLWFGVSKVGDSAVFKFALLVLAAVGNLGLILVLYRLRYIMEEYLTWIEGYNANGFVKADGTNFLNRPRCVRNAFQIVLGLAALISIVLMGFMVMGKEQLLDTTGESQRSLRYYEKHAQDLADAYESLNFEDAHPELVSKLANGGRLVLDVGSGSGRDAAWMARNGNSVVAVDPSDSMLALGRTAHSDTTVQWIKDSLPALEHVRAASQRFDIILMSAVWMHVHPADRDQALSVLSSLLRPGGQIYMTLRKGPASLERGIYTVSVEEVRRLAEKAGLKVRDLGDRPDLIGRQEVRWHSLILFKD